MNKMLNQKDDSFWAESGSPNFCTDWKGAEPSLEENVEIDIARQNTFTKVGCKFGSPNLENHGKNTIRNVPHFIVNPKDSVTVEKSTRTVSVKPRFVKV